MKKVREVPATVVRLLQRAALAGKARGEIHWSNTKKKFVKGNNRTPASEEQVLQYLKDHPDETTRQRAIIHLGPGVIPPAITPSDTSDSALAEIAKLEQKIDEYREGIQRDAQGLLGQAQEALRSLGEVKQQLESTRQVLDQRGLAGRELASKIDRLNDNILQVATQLKDQEATFGRTNDGLAQSIAFNQQLHDLLQEMRQQLQDLQQEFEEWQSQRINANPAPSDVYYPGWGSIFVLVVTALLAAVLVTTIAVRDDGDWLQLPDIAWGLVAAIIVFLGLYVALWHLAESNARSVAAREN